MIRALLETWSAHSRRYFWWILIGMAVTAVAVILFATRWGAALSDDSYYYIKPARDILAGQAPQFRPHYPPLLPLVVTLLGLLRIEPLFALRLLNALCFGLNVILAGRIVERMTNSRGAGLAAAVLMLTSSVMVEVHSWAMSEALFITLTFAMILDFDRYFQTRTMFWLVGTAVMAGLVSLTRYAGIGIIGAGGMALLFTPGLPWGRRLRSALIFGAIAGGMFAAYTVVYAAALNELNSFGGVRLTLVDLSDLREAFYTILLWFMPGRLARGRETLVMFGVIGAVLAAVAAYFVLARRAVCENWQVVRAQPLYLLLALIIAANLFMLYQAHISPIYRSPFDTRLLSPTHAVFLLLLSALLALVWQQNSAILRVGIALLLVWGLFLYLPRSAQYVLDLRDHGAGFATPYWHNLDAARFFTNHSQDEVITSAPMGVYFALGIQVKGVAMNPDMLRAHLRETNGYLVVFNSMPLDLYGYPADEFLQGLTPIEEYSDCVVYQVKP